MASVADHLNELLYRERGEVEAVQELLKEIEGTDPDIAATARDAFDTAQWSCQGLYHRIVRLGGTPTLDAADLAERLSELPTTEEKVELICKEQRHDLSRISDLLRDSEVDEDTRLFLRELLRAHQETKKWCDDVLSQWKADS